MPGRLRSQVKTTARATFVLGVLAWLCTSGLASAGPDPDDLPVGTVAVVSHVPPGLRTITRVDLARAIAQAAAEEGQSRPPRRGVPGYEQVEARALDQLLEAADLQGEAIERGTTVTAAEITAEIARIVRQHFKSPAEYRRYLSQSKLTLGEARDRIELQLLVQHFQSQVTKDVRGSDAQAKALLSFFNNYEKKWRARNTCAPVYATVRCSNGPRTATETPA